MAADPRWEAEEVRAVHAGDAVSNNSINQRAMDGLVAVGDAVSSINPLFGEGIRPGMESAEMAADAALAALDRGDTSREGLSTYEERWNGRKGSSGGPSGSSASCSTTSRRANSAGSSPAPAG
ncbi:NAD(P)/FAD-dependent oxidoreductase [Halosimplex aquaticum]